MLSNVIILFNIIMLVVFNMFLFVNTNNKQKLKNNLIAMIIVAILYTTADIILFANESRLLIVLTELYFTIGIIHNYIKIRRSNQLMWLKAYTYDVIKDNELFLLNKCKISIDDSTVEYNGLILNNTMNIVINKDNSVEREYCTLESIQFLSSLSLICVAFLTYRAIITSNVKFLAIIGCLTISIVSLSIQVLFKNEKFKLFLDCCCYAGLAMSVVITVIPLLN